ncbi:MAG TPA: 30S ribosomal protein S24e [Candidatus Methanoperedenaceae archaeon]|nr:30S ribosomal protein S24e [Candidatus Methanoperedenaceae archaeon]
MEIEITGDRTNQLVGRRDIVMRIKHAGTATPGREALKSKIVALLNTKPELVVIKSIDTAFGAQESTGNVSVYTDEKRAKQMTADFLFKRGLPKEKKEGEKPAEVAKPAEAKAPEKAAAEVAKPAAAKGKE